MFKERVKTSIIIMLLLNCIFLTYHMWFKSGMLGADLSFVSLSDLPFVRFFSSDDNPSVPKENLSKPRKFVIYDGSLWIPYYNTDEAFDNLNEETVGILRSLLSGNAKTQTKISYEKWLDYLTKPSVYVEYPIEVSPRFLAAVINADFEKMPSDMALVRDAIIIPEGENGVRVALRDVSDNSAYEFFIEDERLAFPEAVLSMYADKYRRDGYYEFAFSTLIGEGLGGGNVKVGDLVLFSDNDSVYQNVFAYNPLEGKSHENLLKSFSFNPRPLRHYPDDYGAENYIENYATVRIFPEGYIEYSAVQDDKGLSLDCDGTNGYEILNAAIDFAEKVWSSVSDEALNVLVSGIEETADGNRFTFDYYYGGREVALGIEKNGMEPLYHAIEIETQNNRIVSYRQCLRAYNAADSSTNQESFISALDYYVELFSQGEDTVITDMYPGYYDSGLSSAVLETTWLGKVDYSDARYPKS